MLDLDYSSISQENVNEGLNRKINNASNGDWYSLLFFMRKLQTLQKEIQNLNNNTNECTAFCKDLNNKTLKLVGELDGRKWENGIQK